MIFDIFFFFFLNFFFFFFAFFFKNHFFIPPTCGVLKSHLKKKKKNFKNFFFFEKKKKKNKYKWVVQKGSSNSFYKNTSNPKYDYVIKNIVLLVFLICEIYLNSTIDNLDGSTELIISIAIEIILRAMTIFIMFLLMSDTFLFQHGLLDVITKKSQIFFYYISYKFYIFNYFKII